MQLHYQKLNPLWWSIEIIVWAGVFFSLFWGRTGCHGDFVFLAQVWPFVVFFEWCDLHIIFCSFLVDAPCNLLLLVGMFNGRKCESNGSALCTPFRCLEPELVSYCILTSDLEANKDTPQQVNNSYSVRQLILFPIDRVK